MTWQYINIYMHRNMLMNSHMRDDQIIFTANVISSRELRANEKR